MSEWLTTPLGGLTINHDGKRRPVKEVDRKRGPYPYYGASGIVDYVIDYLIDGDYLLIAEDGENLRTRQTPIAFMARGKSWVNNHAHIVTGNERADTRFLMYAIQAQDVSPYLTGAVMPKLTQGNLNKIPITHPKEVDEQRAIVHILGTLDDKIELNRRINETLEAMARAIFKSWFVDFDPVRAKASGEPPESICRRLGLSPDVLALFPDSFQDSEFGEIPASWYISTLATEAKRFGGFIQTGPFGSQLHAADYVDEGVPVVMPQDLVNRRISVERIARVTAEMAQRLSRHSVKPGDVVYSRRGDVERHALVSEREAGWLCGTGCLLVRLGDAWPSQAYLSEVLDLPVTREWLVRHAVGATMPNLNTTILGNMPFLIPSESLLHAFESIAGPLRKLQIDKCVESDLLAVTRDTLLPKLLSGELSPNRVSVESLP